MKPPATFIIGEVVRLRETLNWYERLPLFGKRIVITRAAGQANTLSARLAELGAGVIELPTIAIHPAADPAPLERAIDELHLYDWLIFTSVNGVQYFTAALDRSRRDLRALKARICAIGPATREAIEALHLKIDLMGKDYVAESLVEAFTGHALAGARVLLPRAAVARDLVPSELARLGARVDVVEAYRTIPPDGLAERIREVFVRPVDAITFTSSSTVKNFVEAAGVELLRGVRAVSIGPITSATAWELGVEIAVEARPYTVDGLVEALVGLYTERTPPSPA
jgi:uroporphyrinogen III methyltransferase/synthase